MIVKLPKWVLVHKFPAFYDTESLTAIEQTARLYGKVNELIDSYNEFADRTNEAMQEFINETDKDNETWRTALRQEFQDFINVIDLKVMELEKEISDFTKSVNNSITNQDSKIELALADFRVEFQRLTATFNTQFNNIVETINSKLGEVDETIAEFNNTFSAKMNEVDNTVSAKMVEVDNTVSAKMVEVDNTVSAKMGEVDGAIAEVEDIIANGVDLSKTANALTKTVTGTSALIDDISPINHKMKLKLNIPNMIDENFYSADFQSGLSNGGEVEFGENTIHYIGYISGNTISIGYLPAGTYRINFKCEEIEYGNVYIEYNGIKHTTTQFTFTQEQDGICILALYSDFGNPDTGEPYQSDLIIENFSCKPAPTIIPKIHITKPDDIFYQGIHTFANTEEVKEIDSSDLTSINVSSELDTIGFELTYNQDLIKVIADLQSKIQ